MVDENYTRNVDSVIDSLSYVINDIDSKITSLNTKKAILIKSQKTLVECNNRLDKTYRNPTYFCENCKKESEEKLLVNKVSVVFNDISLFKNYSFCSYKCMKALVDFGINKFKKSEEE